MGLSALVMLYIYLLWLAWVAQRYRTYFKSFTKGSVLYGQYWTFNIIIIELEQVYTTERVTTMDKLKARAHYFSHMRLDSIFPRERRHDVSLTDRVDSYCFLQVSLVQRRLVASLRALITT